MPRHVNPSTEGRTARAPYNFVPLPNAVFTVADGVKVGETPSRPWEAQDRYLPGTHSGWIDLRLTTKTPLFIRGMALRSDEAIESRRRSEPFTVPDPEHPGERLPAIPGSSLRGAIRTLVEILSFSKIVPVSPESPFFRTVGKDRLGLAYRERMVRGNVKPAGGFLHFDGGRFTIEPADVLRMPHEILERETVFRYRVHPSYSPSHEYPQLQYREVWVRCGENARCTHIALEAPAEAGWLSGQLVLTGSAAGRKGSKQAKKAEFVFLRRAPPAAKLTIPDRIRDRFLDDDQLTNWQEESWPETTVRRTAGHPLDGEPVFYLLDEARVVPENPAGLVFFGRAQMFRLPYDKSPADLVSPELSGAGLDMAEALFGYVRCKAGDEHDALGSRVRVDDAVAVRGGPPWTERPLVPRILASPKPTAFPHYLTQDGREPAEKLTTYLAGDATTIRGHKLYWHRWDDTGLARVEQSGTDGRLPDRDTQSTVIEPVRAGVVFEGRVRFDNLADVELGALLEALQLPDTCAHKLGMAKPLGLGSVRIEVEGVTFIDRQVRYAGWGHDGRGCDEAVVARCRDAFTDAILAHARRSNETLIPGASGLRSIARLDALCRLLTWDGRPAAADTRYMVIEGGDASRFGSPNEFKERAVLPTPHAVFRVPEPPWPPDPPRVVATDPVLASQGTASQPDPTTIHDTPMAPPSASERTRVEVRRGETVECEVLPERTKRGGLRFRIQADGRTGVLHPRSPSPGELKAGDTVRLIVEAAGTEYMLRWPGGESRC